MYSEAIVGWPKRAIVGGCTDRKERAEEREKEGCGLGRGRGRGGRGGGGAEVDGEVTVGKKGGYSAAGVCSKLFVEVDVVYGRIRLEWYRTRKLRRRIEV